MKYIAFILVFIIIAFGGCAFHVWKAKTLSRATGMSFIKAFLVTMK